MKQSLLLKTNTELKKQSLGRWVRFQIQIKNVTLKLQSSSVKPSHIFYPMWPVTAQHALRGVTFKKKLLANGSSC